MEMIKILLELKEEVSCIRCELLMLSKGKKINPGADLDDDSASSQSGVEMEGGKFVRALIICQLFHIF